MRLTSKCLRTVSIAIEWHPSRTWVSIAKVLTNPHPIPCEGRIRESIYVHLSAGGRASRERTSGVSPGHTMPYDVRCS